MEYKSDKSPAILVVSFGSSVEEARAKAIAPIEQLIVTTFPNYHVATAYTSNFIRAKLAKQGIVIDSAYEALEKLIEQGYKKIYIQPLHILAGFEFEKIQEAVSKLSTPELKLILGKPLMTEESDLDSIIEAINHQEELTIYIGHGTNHPINHLYEKLEVRLMEKAGNTYVGTVEEGPIPLLERFEYSVNHKNDPHHKTEVHLKPFLLVAGDHVINDINGTSEDSWFNAFSVKGYDVITDQRGLGELVQFQQLFVGRVKALIEKGE